jgi:hypothetical protein
MANHSAGQTVGLEMVYQGNCQWVIGQTLQYNSNVSASLLPAGHPGVPQMVRTLGDVGDISCEPILTLNTPTKEEHTKLQSEVDRLTEIVKNQNDDIIQLFNEVQKMQRLLHAATTRSPQGRGVSPGYWEPA